MKMKQSTYLRKVLHALVVDGWGHFTIFGEPCATISAVMKEMNAVGDATIIMRKGSDQTLYPATAWIRAVWQGPDVLTDADSASEILADYTVNLSSIIDPIVTALDNV